MLVLDRDEIGAHPTSACAAPMPWLEALGLEGSVKQELPFMRFTTPHGSSRVRLPWSWGAFDYAELCRLLWDQSRRALRARAREGSRRRRRAHRPRHRQGAARRRRSRLAPRARLAAVRRRPAVRSRVGSRSIRTAAGDALDVVIDRSLVRRGYCWRVPAGDEVRVGAGAYDPRVAVKQPTADIAGRFGVPPVRHQGNLIPHRLRPAAENGCFFVGDSAGHCFALSAEGHPRRVLLRDRVRPRAAPRARGRRDRRRGARVLQRLQRAPSQRVLDHVRAAARHSRAAAARAHRS